MATQSIFLGVKFGGWCWHVGWHACMLGWQFLGSIIKVIFDSGQPVYEQYFRRT